jgi:hypothetical protein
MIWKFGAFLSAALAVWAIGGHGTALAAGADVNSEVLRGHDCWSIPSWGGIDIEAEVCVSAMSVGQTVQTPEGNFKYTGNSWDEFTVTQAGQLVYSDSHSAHVHDLEAAGELLSVHMQLTETYWDADQVCTARFDYRLQIATGEVIFEVADFSCR